MSTMVIFEFAGGRAARQIEDQLDDPSAGEDLAVFASFVDLMHVRVHPEPVAEALLLR